MGGTQVGGRRWRQTVDLAPARRYYDEYQWLVDFSVYALLVYACAEAYIFLLPARAAQEINLSMVTCLLVAGSAYKVSRWSDLFQSGLTC